MRIKKLLLSSRGFTLIELLVVISIMGAMSMLGVSTFANYSRTQRFNQAVTDFVNNLNTAKSKTYAQAKPDINGCNNGNVLNGFSIDINPHKYDLFVNCSGTPSRTRIYASPDYTPLDISFTKVPGSPPNGSVYFHVLTGAVTGDRTIRIYDSYGNTKIINITSVGVISVQ